MTQLYLLTLVTPAAEDLVLVIEARTEMDALWQAQDTACDIGLMDDDDIHDGDSEVWFDGPNIIAPMTGSPGERMSSHY